MKIVIGGAGVALFFVCVGACRAPAPSPAVAPAIEIVRQDASSGSSMEASRGFVADRTPTVIAPGHEPRAPRRFAFVEGTVAKRVFTLRDTIEDVPAEPRPRISVSTVMTVKAVTNGTARWELEVTAVRVASDADLKGTKKPNPHTAAMTREFASGVGVRVEFDVDAHGRFDAFRSLTEEKAKEPGAATVVEVLQSALEVLFPTFPADSVGIGAQWESIEDEGGIRSVERFELRRDATLERRAEEHMTKGPLTHNPRAMGAMVVADTTTTTTYVMGSDSVPTQVRSQKHQKVTVTVPDGSESRVDSTNVTRLLAIDAVE